MPIKPIPPRKGFSPFYYGRGTYLGVFVNRSTCATRAKIAKRVIETWERDIESGRFDTKGDTFMSAAVAYMKADGDKRPLAKLIAHFGETPLTEIGQAEIDAAAVTLFPSHTNATRNREVYSPVSAVMKHAGRDFRIKRPKGSRGRELTGWLWPEQVEPLLIECYKVDIEFGIMCLGYYYTGLRLTEWARYFTCDRLRLSEAYAFIPRTKNGAPRPVFLPPQLVTALANHPRGLDRGDEPVFRFHKGGRLYDMLKLAAKRAGIELPERQKFHIFRHTYGTQMSRVAGLSTRALVATGAWKSMQAASRYQHMVVTEEAQKAALLPVPKLKFGA